MANRDFNKIKRTIQDFSLGAGEGGGSSDTVSRTFKVSLDVQCYWRELTFIYDSDDTTPNYTPQYQEESGTWTGLEELVAHFKEVLANGKVIYGYGYGQDPVTSENTTYPFAMRWFSQEEEPTYEGIEVCEVINNGELATGAYIDSEGDTLWPETTITDYISE